MKLRYELYKKLKGGKTITIKPTVRCNLDCDYCSMEWLERKKFKEVGYMEWVRLIEKIKPTVVNISGGEPMLYNDITDLINGLVKRKYLISIVSNLTVYRELKKSWRIVFYATYHKQAPLEFFKFRLSGYRKRFHVSVWEFGEQMIKGSKKKKLKTKPNMEKVEVYAPDLTKYDNCYLS